jgi:thiamine pyrophosphate-dependent acetolactate synthase large subunit-like protein
LVVTGDGDVLMALGSLATIGVKQPKNLAIVCLDNGHYSVSGMQPSATKAGVDLAEAARACKLRVEAVSDLSCADELRDLLHSGEGAVHPCSRRCRRPASCRTEPRRRRHQTPLHAGDRDISLTGEGQRAM